MKRLIVAAAFLMAFIWPASVIAALPSWNLTGSYTVEFNCTAGDCLGMTYVHSMTITSSNNTTGAVAGSGSIEGQPTYDWTMTGTVSGSDATLDILWSVGSGLTVYNPLVLTGTIDAMGGMSGTAVDGAMRTFDWATTSGAATAVDRTKPTAAIAPPATPTNAATLDYALTFSESVTGLVAGDFTRTGTATGCTVGAPSGSGAAYSVAVTGCSEGTVILALKANSVSDGQANTGPASDVIAASVTIDRSGPTAAIAPPATPTNAATLDYALTFSESVTGLVAGDFTRTGTATGCTVGAPSGSGAAYSVAVTGCSEGTVILALKANSVSDGQANTGPASDVIAASVTIDRSGPTAAIAPPATPTNAATLDYALTFSESVTGLVAGDFTRTGTATGCTVGAPSGSGAAYSVAVTGCSEGTVILALKANSVSDGQANTGPASDVIAASVTIDRSGPTAAIAPPATPTNAATLDYALTFSESVTGLVAGDFTRTGTATGCTVGAPSGSGAAYSVAVTGCSEGTVILALKANSVSDGQANTGPASDVIAASVTIDRSGPTAAIAPPATPTNAATLDYALTFSESVTGLVAGDFTRTGTATGCTVGAPSGSGAAYSVAVTGCSEGTVILALKANSVSDGQANTGPASDVIAASVTIDRTKPSTSALTAKPRTGAALSGTLIPLGLTWSGGDNSGGSGLDRYEIERSVDGGTWAAVAAATGSPASVSAASSGSVRYRVRAVDKADNQGDWAYSRTLTPRLTQQTSSTVTYSGTWTSSSSASFSGGSARYASVAGRSASYRFYGRSIALVATKSTTRGKVKIYVDGAFVATVDLYRSSTQYRAVAWETTWSTSATRTVKIVVVGTSGRPRVDLDAFVVLK